MAGKFTRLYQLTRQPTLARTYVIRKTKSSRLTEHEHNAHLVQILTEHIHFLQTTPDTSDSAEKVGYKLRAYERAVRALRALDHKLETIDEARQIKSIGVRILDRLSPHIDPTVAPPSPPKPRKGKTAKAQISNLTYISDAEKAEKSAIQSLQTVSGIGKVKATALVTAGCLSLKDLFQPQFMNELTNHQRIGLRYLNDIESRVTRQESEIVADFVKEHLESKEFEVILGGSYRRGRETSGDIDLIVVAREPNVIPIPPPPSPSLPGSLKPTKVKAKTKATLLDDNKLIKEVVRPLEELGVLAASLSSGLSKWQGIVLVPDKSEGKWLSTSERLAVIHAKNTDVSDVKAKFRRMDINLVPKESRGAALLALTGDTEYNRDLRFTAIKLGMRLNEFGLWRWSDDSEWILVSSETEEAVLAELGKEWIDATKRNWEFIATKR